MKTLQTLNVAIAESSIIVRNGLSSVLKHLANVKIMPTEITSIEGLHHCMRGHNLDMIVVDPTFEGGFNLKEFKAQYPSTPVKFIALLCSVTDHNLLKEYDGNILLYDGLDELNQKITALAQLEDDTPEEDQGTLSDREKEIICYVVKGMTNKEIAEQLCISVHTVITHRRNISKKLQIHSPAGLTIYAIVNKLVELKEVKL